ncbi:hypothetical protein ACHAXH_003998 [Discostella pseudostelligera]
MARIQSFDIESDASPGGKVRHPYGPQGGGVGNNNTLSPNSARAYFMIGLAISVFIGIGKMLYPATTNNSAYDEWRESKAKGDGSGGWGMKHNHPIVSNSVSNNDVDRASANRIQPSSQSSSSSSSSTQNTSKIAATTIDNIDHELWESDLLQLLSPLVIIPSHPLHEYRKYQTNDFVGSGTKFAVDMLYDKSTPHGKAFDFLLNRDTRPHQIDNSALLLKDDMQYLVQRFVVTLLFYATGGRDTIHNDTQSSKMEREKKGNETDGMGMTKRSGSGGGGWESSTAHFLTGLHECHWVRKSLEDQFWSMLSIDKEKDRRVGVTKCNANMEVTEICLADLNLVGFIPEEVKWLSNLEYLDMQNNHLTGPIPESLGELDELRYISLDGNSLSGTIPDVFQNLLHLERAFLNFNDFNSSMPPSMCNLREEGALKDLWSDCGGYPITCTCCTVCCDMVAECSEMESQKGG